MSIMTTTITTATPTMTRDRFGDAAHTFSHTLLLFHCTEHSSDTLVIRQDLHTNSCLVNVIKKAHAGSVSLSSIYSIK